MMHSSIYWKAVYNDGKELSQYEEDGKENKYPDIDRSKLSAFEIRKAGIIQPKAVPDQLLFKMYLEPGRRLIYRRRVLEKYKFGGGARDIKAKPIGRSIIYLVGWQATIGGRSVQDIAYVFEDGHVELSGIWREAPYNAIGNPIPAETKCYDEQHFSVGAVIVKRDNTQAAADAILVKKKDGDKSD